MSGLDEPSQVGAQGLELEQEGAGVDLGTECPLGRSVIAALVLCLSLWALGDRLLLLSTTPEFATEVTLYRSDAPGVGSWEEGSLDLRDPWGRRFRSTLLEVPEPATGTQSMAPSVTVIERILYSLGPNGREPGEDFLG